MPPQSGLLEWFQVRFDGDLISLQVSPPGRPAWEAQIKWERIIRICFKAGGWDSPDELYLFTDERPESYLVPMHAVGADALWDEILRRELFDAEMAIKAASSIDKLFCWPAE
ncbi:MAG TPA: hypothetical protein VGO96_12710 [Pyrinomonadaceae bacterium]|nr:hypothetical protein [Pyrinomonadaceae bacterium]